MQEKIKNKIFWVFKLFNFSEATFSVIVAVVLGIISGLFAVLFRKMVIFSTSFFLGYGEGLLTSVSDYGLVLIPAVGGLIVGLLTYYLAPEAKGHGVPEVMEAVALNNGKIRVRAIFVKAVASAVSIGSGGSIGREGPIVQMGSGIGSVLGQFFDLSSEKIKTLVGCGAAAGIAGTFNAPIAGVFFALEIILSEFVPSTFGLVVISSVAASMVTHIFVGNHPAFMVPEYSLTHPVEFLFYAILGLCAAGLGWLFVSSLYSLEDIFEEWNFPPYLKPVIGGFIIGFLGLKFREILGVGYEVIEKALHNQLLLPILFILVFLKILATSVTLGSGHSGGVFAPSLFIGAALGGSLGVLVHSLYPALTASPGAYALVGMGAVVAGTTQAPMTAILIIFELTRDYRIILPLMVACVISTAIFAIISKEGNIYTRKLHKRGINLHSGRDINILDSLSVREAMVKADKVDVAFAESNVGDVIHMIQNSRHTGFPVINKEHELVGLITLDDIRDIPSEERMRASLDEHMATDLIVTYPDENLDEVFKKFGFNDVGRLPVVARENENKLLGLITRSDVINAYDKELLKLNGNAQDIENVSIENSELIQL